MKSDEPLVCICIPNYNNEKTIAETLDSLIAQTYRNIIIKVFDNASTDSSLSILREFEKKYEHIQVFESDKNIGAEGNFTKCIEYMEGDYSAIYHSDDIYMPTIVEEEVAFLESNSDCCAVFTNAYLINDGGKIFGKNYFPAKFIKKSFVKFNFLELLKSTMQYDNFLQCPSALIKTNVYRNDIKKWAVSEFNTASDVAVWFRLSKIENIAVLNKRLYKYRVSMNSYSYRELRKRLIEKDLFKVLDFYIEQNICDLSDSDFNNYEFLKFKESLLITKNQIINSLSNIKYRPMKIKKINMLKSIFSFKKIKFIFFLFFVKVFFLLTDFIVRR